MSGSRVSDMGGATGKGAKSFRSDLTRIYLPAVAGFLVINITNGTILNLLAKHGLLYVATADLADNEVRTAQFFLIPAKALLFAICTAVLGLQLMAPVKRMARQLTAGAVVQSLIAVGVGLVLTATLLPLGFGRSYARISTDPFNQMPNQLYRRMLMPGLAYVWHLNGFLYAVLVWAVLFAAVLAAKAYLRSKGHRLSLLAEVSLLTVGVFITSFQVPGNPEAAVLLLALIALMDFERTGEFSGVQLAALGLALMAHETCAFIMFAPMILFLFPKRSWIPCLAVGLAYGVTLMANFSFDVKIPMQIQSTVSEIPSRVYFLKSPGVDLAAVFFSFKLLWIFVLVGVYHQFKEKPRTALFVVSGFALAISSMYFAVDYTRLIGFATICMLVCYQEAAKHLSRGMFKTIVAVNLVVPTLFVSGLGRLTTFRGLYLFSARWLVHVIGPRI